MTRRGGPPLEDAAAKWLAAAIDLLAKARSECGSQTVRRIAREASKSVTQNEPVQIPRRKSGPHKKTVEFVQEWDVTYDRQKAFLRASPRQLNEWILRLRRNIAERKSDNGSPITPSEAEAISGYISELEKRRDDLASGKIKNPRKGEIKKQLAETFTESGFYGRPRGNQDAESFVTDKLKRGRRAARRNGSSK